MATAVIKGIPVTGTAAEIAEIINKTVVKDKVAMAFPLTPSMPEPYEPKVGLNGQYENERCHWCQWCGLRGITMAINPEEE